MLRIPYSLALLAASGLLSSVASAQVFHGASSSSTVLHGGDRELRSLSFSGASNSMTGADFARFADGSLTTYISGNVSGPYAWNSPVPRDMSTAGNSITGNPDRADNSTPFLGEAGKTGTLAEVFGTGRLGYKNMSWIIDGEVACDVERYTLDLYFTPGFTLAADNKTSTVELALLERGINSDLKITGLRADRSLASSIFIPRTSVTAAGWNLDTLEIGEPQAVGGVGISIAQDWTNITGLRIEQFDGYNGPDIVGIGVVNNVPAPGPLVLSCLGSLLLFQRRRA